MQRIKITPIQAFSSTPEKSKSYMVMKYFFSIIQILSGFDLGFLEHKMVKRNLRKSIFFIYVSSFIIIFLLALYNSFIGRDLIISYIFWVFFYLFQYVLTFLCFLFMRSDKTFCQLHHDLELIDSMLKVRGDSYRVEMKLLIAAGLVATTKSIMYLYGCTENQIGFEQCSQYPLLSFLSSAMVILLTIIHIVCASVFFAFYCRMRSLKAILSADRANYGAMRCIYKSIADLIETYKSEFDLLILSSIVFNTIELMAAILSVVFGVNDEFTNWAWLAGLSVILDLMHTFSAAICAGMVTKQVDGILITLHDKLLFEREENRIRELQQLITYVSARRLKLRLYHVIPLDASFIGMIFNFCVTYLIVIIQFSSK